MDKRRIISNIFIVSICMLIGLGIGFYCAKVNQEHMNSPEYIAFLNENEMEMTEPMTKADIIIGFSLLIGGVATGIIGYISFLKRYVKLERMSKLLLFVVSILLFPLYTVFGAVACIPFLIYQIYQLTSRNRRKSHA